MGHRAAAAIAGELAAVTKRRGHGGISFTCPSRPVSWKPCACGGMITDRGVGKIPRQCDACRHKARGLRSATQSAQRAQRNRGVP